MTTFQIDVQNEGAYPVDADRLRGAARAVLSAHDVAPGSALTVVITGDDDVAALNRQYRGIDAPTDVLSFPADAPPVDEENAAPYLGDLVIAFPYASAQAAREGHDLMDSLSLLVVHGTLHLLGYDHGDPAEKAEMWAAQADALQALGVPVSIVPGLEGGHDDGEVEN